MYLWFRGQLCFCPRHEHAGLAGVHCPRMVHGKVIGHKVDHQPQPPDMQAVPQVNKGSIAAERLGDMVRRLSGKGAGLADWQYTAKPKGVAKVTRADSGSMLG